MIRQKYKNIFLNFKQRFSFTLMEYDETTILLLYIVLFKQISFNKYNCYDKLIHVFIKCNNRFILYCYKKHNLNSFLYKIINSIIQFPNINESNCVTVFNLDKTCIENIIQTFKTICNTDKNI